MESKRHARKNSIQVQEKIPYPLKESGGPNDKQRTIRYESLPFEQNANKTKMVVGVHMGDMDTASGRENEPKDGK